MRSNKEKVLISFASGILKHFNDLLDPILGEYILRLDSIVIVLLFMGKRITTTIPYKVISNAMQHIEALKIMRYEIILELTQTLRVASKIYTKSNGSIITSPVKRKHCHGKRR